MKNLEQEKEIKKILLNIYRIKNNLKSFKDLDETSHLNKDYYIENAVKELTKIDKELCKILDIKFSDKDKKLVMDLIG